MTASYDRNVEEPAIGDPAKDVSRVANESLAVLKAILLGIQKLCDEMLHESSDLLEEANEAE